MRVLLFGKDGQVGRSLVDKLSEHPKAVFLGRDALDLSKFAIRHQVTETINMKFSPELKFYYDKGLENAIEVESVLKKVL